MKKQLLIGMSTILVVCMMLSCSEPTNVVQGVVVSYDKASKQLVMTDESAPNEPVTLNLSSAEMGADPVAGDTVRISYVAESKAALRVMNLSHQSH